jgi:hypothetical protein
VNSGEARLCWSRTATSPLIRSWGLESDVCVQRQPQCANAFQQWHSDGTEIHNSQAPAAAGNICLGVWKKTGKSHYTLNHFYLNSDPTTDTLHARVQLREEIDLSHSGDEHFGIVTFDVYDLAGNLLDHTQATVHATRITVKTDLKELF